MDDKRDQIHVELATDVIEDTRSPKEVELIDGKTTYLVPTPSADPNGRHRTIMRIINILTRVFKILSTSPRGASGQSYSLSRPTLVRQWSWPLGWVQSSR